ncbi:chromosome transmission fidelity protein 18 [Echria macrotheca]|uniref:Chromosome transmission fidelity protein 18 n=1 Tax=Echria macrotheca TaxID=438768 RepID=A0AAJ0BEX2_9PEZI|nr:chromosome transmission fidelity protein 18 [Echria macrotheca]
MLGPSSPVAFPSSSPQHGKRPRSEAPKAKPRVVGGFVDSDDDEAVEEPSPKRRMLEPNTQDAQKSKSQPATQDAQVPKDQDIPMQDTISTPPDSQPDDFEEETERYERLFGTQPTSKLSSFVLKDRHPSYSYQLETCAGKSVSIRERKPTAKVSYATMVAARSRTKEGRAKKEFYGIDIHDLIDSAKQEIAARKDVPTPITPPPNPDRPVQSVEATQPKRHKRTLLWTEKYRARNFMDLVGDDLTNRQVLRWLKKWDPIVFPHAVKNKPRIRPGQQSQQPQDEEKPHRKILMLTGPPGLGKTTLAHVCARQAGYEVMEINASDDRSKDVVKGRIRTSLGTETVKTVENKKSHAGKQPKVARPVCVVVDEVDGAVTGSGGSGEGGFVRALIDLVTLDQKNAAGAGASAGQGRRKKKTDDFRQMRPLILICNDVYHPSLRPLRQSGLAEIIHVGKPSVEAVVTRLKAVFEKEGIPCEKDAARKLCEAAWGITSGLDAKKGLESNAEGDLRGVMVVGEWVAGRLRATSPGGTPALTRQWVDKHVLKDLAHGGGGARGLGRGGVKEIVNRIFQEGAGFPKQELTAATTQSSKKTRHEQPQAQLGFLEQQKKYAMSRLSEMIETSGDIDRIMTEVFAEYPNREYNDDSFLTKPNAAAEWMYFHDTCSARLFGSQVWELAAYVSQPILACHHLFASPRRYQPPQSKWGEGEQQQQPLPFTGPRADYLAYEAEKVNRATLQGIQSQLPPHLYRAFRSPEDLATDFLPYLVRLVSPDVKPVVVGGSDKNGLSVASVRREGEKAMVRRAAAVLAEVGIELHKGRIEDVAGGPVARTQWVYRMEPDIDHLATYETAGALLAVQAPTRYAVRQVLDQELQRTIAQRESAARQARLRAGNSSFVEPGFDDKENKNKSSKSTRVRREDEGGVAVKRDFFGRVIVEQSRPPLEERDLNGGGGAGRKKNGEEKSTKQGKVWVTYHEGLNNAVRKPISLEEFLRGF